MIAIRSARAEDAAAIAAIYAPYVLTGVVSFETDAPDARELSLLRAMVIEVTNYLRRTLK